MSHHHVLYPQVAMGFIKVANETMCRPIRALTQMKGYDVAAHALACFGGAGGQHACAIARSLGMKTIFIHRYSGILSAVGIGLADVVAEEQVCDASLGCILSAVGIGLADIVAEEQVGNTFTQACCGHTVPHRVTLFSALERQDLSCTYLAHHELESNFMMMIIIIIITQACWLAVATQACYGQAVHWFIITLCILVKVGPVVSGLVGTRSCARWLAAFYKLLRLVL